MDSGGQLQFPEKQLDKSNQPLGFPFHRPHRLQENNFIKLIHIISKRLLAVLIEEKAGIGQAGAQHPLISGLHILQVSIICTVADSDKVRHYLPVSIENGEITLVDAHNGNQHFLRQLQVLA